MTHVHGAVLVLFVAASLGVALGNVVVALALRQRPRGAAFTPSSPSPKALVHRFVALGVAPVVFGVVLVATALMPSLLSSLGVVADHCAAAPGHPHLCFEHSVLWPLSPLELGLAGSAFVALVLVVVVEAQRLVRARQALHALRAQAGGSGGVWQLDSDEPLAFSAGLLSPMIYVSRGLVERVGAASLEVILAHERAHASSRHALVRWLVGLCGVALCRPLREDVTAHLTLAQERVADEEAALVVGDRLLVADALLAAYRLTRTSVPLGACSVASSPVEARVEALCAAPSVGARSSMLLVVLPALLLGAVALSVPLHALVEDTTAALLSVGAEHDGHGPASHTHE